MTRQHRLSTSAPFDVSQAIPAFVSASIPTVATSSSANERTKQRVPHSRRTGRAESKEEAEMNHDEDIPMAEHPLLVDGDDHDSNPVTPPAAAKNKWIFFALASGACAAFNGVFAKL